MECKRLGLTDLTKIRSFGEEQPSAKKIPKPASVLLVGQLVLKEDAI